MSIFSVLFGKKKDETPTVKSSVPKTANITAEATPNLHLRGKADSNGLYPSELVMLAVADPMRGSPQRWSWRGTWACGSATSSNCDPATSCGMEIAIAWRSWSRKQENAGYSQSPS